MRHSGTCSSTAVNLASESPYRIHVDRAVDLVCCTAVPRVYILNLVLNLVPWHEEYVYMHLTGVTVRL